MRQEEEGHRRRLIESTLGRVPLFSRLSPFVRTELAGLLQPHHYDRSELIIYEGEPGDALYIIESGQVVVEHDGQFIAHLDETGGEVSGTITEPDNSGVEDIRRAFVDGDRTGARLRFMKQYDPAGALAHSVAYAGTINDDGTSVYGTSPQFVNEAAQDYRRRGMIADARALVVGNTGPAHLASAVGTPVVSLFAPTVPAARWRPWRVAHRLLGDQAIACAGCRARVCPIPGQPCLAGVGVRDVLRAIASLDNDRDPADESWRRCFSTA